MIAAPKYRLAVLKGENGEQADRRERLIEDQIVYFNKIQEDMERVLGGVAMSFHADTNNDDCDDEDDYISTERPRKNPVAPLNLNRLHDATIQMLLDSDKTLRRGNFRHTVHSVFPEIDMVEFSDEFQRRPDMFRLCNNYFCKSITVYEVEDTSVLKPDKIYEYSFLWDILLQYDINLMLVVYDRYGGKPHHINLMDWFYLSIQDAVKRGSHDRSRITQ